MLTDVRAFQIRRDPSAVASRYLRRPQDTGHTNPPPLPSPPFLYDRNVTRTADFQRSDQAPAPNPNHLTARQSTLQAMASAPQAHPSHSAGHSPNPRRAVSPPLQRNSIEVTLNNNIHNYNTTRDARRRSARHATEENARNARERRIEARRLRASSWRLPRHIDDRLCHCCCVLVVLACIFVVLIGAIWYFFPATPSNSSSPITADSDPTTADHGLRAVAGPVADTIQLAPVTSVPSRTLKLFDFGCGEEGMEEGS